MKNDLTRQQGAMTLDYGTRNRCRKALGEFRQVGLLATRRPVLVGVAICFALLLFNASPTCAEGFRETSRRIAAAPVQEETVLTPPDATGVKATALHHGMYEIVLATVDSVGNPYFDAQIQVAFQRPDGTKTIVDGFYDGNRVFRAKAYCDTIGRWQWSSISNRPSLDERNGEFQVVASSLPGKLRQHPDDSRQFAYDNGEWFLHLGDTGYRYVARDEPHWREYIDQAAKMGATKIRTWFCQSRHGVEGLFDRDRGELDLACWQEIDRRIAYAFEHHPNVILQLIPFGEDTEELKRYANGDRASTMAIRYAQARFSAYPNILWCISNDREIVKSNRPLKGRQIRAETIDRIGRDMARREPWKTLITNHQSRFKGYSFVDASWSDIITLEDLDQTSGKLIAEYRSQGDDPIVLDEDRYEQYRAAEHPRYFFRRLMWASLLSGGSATYGGLRTYEPREYVATKPNEMKDIESRGVSGYYDAVRDGRLKGGADDFVHFHQFFADANLTLVGMTPDDAIVGGDSAKWKCTHNDKVFVVYLANPSGSSPESDQTAIEPPSVTVQLADGKFAVKWFHPRTGQWTDGDASGGGNRSFLAPGSGDWVLLLRSK